MRAVGLAIVALALLASPASAAVIEIEDHFCGCDSSSGEGDTRGLLVRAAPGETNLIIVRRSPRGIVIDDAGAPLTGACRPATAGGRFCRGEFDGWTSSSATATTGSSTAPREARSTPVPVTTTFA